MCVRVAIYVSLYLYDLARESIAAGGFLFFFSVDARVSVCVNVLARVHLLTFTGKSKFDLIQKAWSFGSSVKSASIDL